MESQGQGLVAVEKRLECEYVILSSVVGQDHLIGTERPGASVGAVSASRL